MHAHMISSFYSGWVCPLLLMATVVTPQLVPVVEMTALCELYNSTSGNMWNWRNERVAGAVWNFTVDNAGRFMDNPCSSSSAALNQTWQGVTCSQTPQACSSQTCHVIEIDLASYEMLGTIPREIGYLSFLETLSLYDNQLTGPIPREVGDLTAMTYLSLYANDLSGAIPQELGLLQALMFLSLDNNRFTGTIPNELGNLTSLVALYIGRTYITGTIPGALGQLQLLEVLGLDYNQLNGTIPSTIWQLTTLKQLELFGNQLSGTISSNVGQLIALELLYLYINQFTGTIPSEVGQLTALVHMGLYDNQLTGTIPSTVGPLTALELLYLQNNILTGVIPSEVGQLTTLDLLSLYNNQLTGTIPSTICQLTATGGLYLYKNHLTGVIPSDVGQLTALDVITLYDNLLTGTIPAAMGQLTALELLYIHNNHLSGTIPEEVGLLTALEVLTLNDNQLTGSMPRVVGQLVSLVLLYLHTNQLSGSIPSTVGQLTALETLVLYSNQLTGTLPTEVGQLTAVELFSLYGNQLTGTIPSEMGQLTTIEYISLYTNLLTGTIPSEVGQITALELLYLHNNQLTGPIPVEVGQLTALELLNFHSNLLTGTIPSEVGRLTSLDRLSLNNNQLTGSVPSTVGDLMSMGELFLSDNSLGGSLPVEISGLRRLRSMFLQNNLFTGHLQGAFNHSTQLEVTTVDISNNRLSGSLPTEMLLLPQLKVLSLSVNCFDEELPLSLCSAGQVEVLSLNGLRAAEGCADRVTMPLSGVGLFNKIGGTVPSCLWSLRNLSVLHLTGNGLSGEIELSLYSSFKISDISLSHNELSGTIPVEILNIANVDLSYNQFSGQYHDHTQYQPDSNISLEINRLSGKLPVSELQRVVNGSMHILRGNLFACQSVPENDEYSRDYVCGSRNLNTSLFVFVSAFGAALLLVLIAISARFVSVQRHRLVTALHSRGVLLWTYLAYLKNVGPHDLKYSPSVRKIAILTGSMVIYTVKILDTSNTYATHSHTYSWFWTLAYMRGVVPAVLLLMLWAVTICACFYRIIVFPMRRTSNSSGSNSQIGTTVFRDHALAVGLAFAFNACITITVNTLYIYSRQQDLGAFINLCTQLSLSIFRLAYIAFAFPILSQPIQNAVENVRFRFILLTINNLIIPCIVTALTSDACFQGLLVPADAISTPYFYRTCVESTTPEGEDTYCSAYDSVEFDSASLVPPFTYSNQCGSVLLTSYIPVFLLGFSIQILLPFVFLALLTYAPYGSMPQSIRNMLHGVICPEYWLEKEDASILTANRAIVSRDPDVLMKMRTIFCNDVSNNLLVLLTFGLCSPVLAVAVACAVWLRMFLWAMLLGRFTKCLVEDNNDRDSFVSAAAVASSASSSESPSHQSEIKSSSVAAAAGARGDEGHFALVALAQVHIPLFDALAGSFWRLVWCSALFIAVLSWDMAADEVGWLPSLWVPLLPLGFAIVLRCIAYFCGNSRGGWKQEGGVSSSHTEIKVVASQHHEALGVSRSPLHEQHDDADRL